MTLSRHSSAPALSFLCRCPGFRFMTAAPAAPLRSGDDVVPADQHAWRVIPPARAGGEQARHQWTPAASISSYVLLRRAACQTYCRGQFVELRVDG